MKTILIAHNYSEVSYNAMSFHLANFLAQNNNVIFLSHHPKDLKNFKENKQNGSLSVYKWPCKNRPNNIKSAIFMAKIYLKYKPEIIIGHFIGGNMALLIAKLLSGFKVKTFYYYHTIHAAILTDLGKKTIKQKIKDFKIKYFFKFFCNVIVCPSLLAKTDIETKFKIHKNIEINNALKDRFLHFAPKNQENIIINYLGRLDQTKGILQMINDFNDYCLQTPTKIILNIAGAGFLLNDLKNLIAKNTNINVLNELNYEQVDAYLQTGHYTIIPSIHDNLPTVGLESLMFGVPLILSNSTGLANYISNEKSSILYEAKPKQLFAVFQKIENNIYPYEDLRTGARALFLKQFEIENYLQTFNKILSTP